MILDRILALLVGGPVRALLALALVVAPLAIWGGWPGIVIAVAVIAATVWRRQAWNGAPRPW